MAKIADLPLSDNAGNEYTFEVYPKETQFNDVAGVYVFTKRDDSNREHSILYIGQTDSFKKRPLNWPHHKYGAATRKGMTHICVLQTSNRERIENKLIENYNPPLNER